MRRLLPKSLAGQLIALLLAGLIVSQLLAFLVLADERRQAIAGALQFGLVERTAAIARLLEETAPERRALALAAVSSHRIRFWMSRESALRSSGGGRRIRWLIHSLEEVLPGEPHDAVRVRFLGERRYRGLWHHGEEHEEDEAGEEDDEEDEEAMEGWGRGRWHDLGLAVSVRLGNGDWLNVVTRIRPRAVGWAWPHVLSMLVMAGVILAAVFVTLRRITRPLTALSGAAERLGRGEAVAPLPETGPREIRRTTAAFNEMQARLSRFLRDRTTLLAALGHDLRTPITALRLRAELVEDEETRNKLLETLAEMQRMTEATLAFAREEAAEETTRRIDLAALVESLCDDFADMGEEVTFAGAAKTPYDCRPTALKRALRNLIENAVAYGRRARAALETTEVDYEIRIEDEGPGIPEEDLGRVFAPFVRLEESRSRETGGVGLGLAIARSIARAHGGDVILENRPEGGLRARLFLPRDAATKT